MTLHLPEAVAGLWTRYLSGDDSEFGVHIPYEDLYDSIVWLVAIYAAGQIASRLLRMPSLVGEIVAGILLGPPLADYVPNPKAWVLLGEIGLVLLVLEAGIDIDVSTLKLIGSRGFLIALIGSILPIAIGIALAIAVNGSDDMKAAIAAGATFGPTSLGIALNILRSGGILNTPVGQLIISAAVIDDMIALVVLSIIDSLSGTITAAGILIPIVSAVAFLVVGGYIALFIVPNIIGKYILNKFDQEHHGKIELAIMIGALLGMMPATHYAKASSLMGAFIAGLGFCTSHDLHVLFVRQFKRIMQWLMRIFFAASIGFQVPIKDFGNGTVIWQGLVFCVALTGKLAVGFMVPNFTQSKSFTGLHLRDCLITGFSMAAEGEFAFVIAVFSVDNDLIDKDLYASVVLAVLLSTIIPPFLLRFTINYYNKKAEAEIQKLADEEMERNHALEADADTDLTDEEREAKLVGEIQSDRAIFLCIQTQSESRWGLLPKIMATLAKMGLDIIDHRSWHPRGINTTLVNEIYVKDKISVAKKGTGQQVLDDRIEEVTKSLESAIGQSDAKVKVQRWFPGVVEEIVEQVHERSKGKSSYNVEQRLLKEASTALDKKQTAQILATKEKSVDEILAGMQAEPSLPMTDETAATTPGVPPVAGRYHGAAKRPCRRRRQKMRSTPVVGGGLFGETAGDKEEEELPAKKPGAAAGTKKWTPDFDFGQRGHRAEIIVHGETYDVRISDQTLKALRTGFSGDMLDSRGVSVSGVTIEPDSSNVVNQLHGYVRSPMPLSKITEEGELDDKSETSSMAASTRPGDAHAEDSHVHHHPHLPPV